MMQGNGLCTIIMQLCDEVMLWPAGMHEPMRARTCHNRLQMGCQLHL